MNETGLPEERYRADADGNKVMVLDLVFPNGIGHVEQLNNIVRRGLQPAQITVGVVVDTGEVDKDGKPVMVAKYKGLHALRHFNARGDDADELAAAEAALLA